MRADAPATCAPRGGGTPNRNKNTTSTEYVAAEEIKFQTGNINQQTTCEIERNKEKTVGDRRKRKTKIIDTKEKIFKTNQLSCVKISSSELSELHELLPYSQCKDKDIKPSGNHEFSETTTILVSQSPSIINCNNDRVSDDYTILSNNSTSESDNVVHEPINTYETDTKFYENPSTSYQSSNKEIESRSSCESIQDIDSDHLHEDCENNLPSNYISKFESSENNIDTIELFKNNSPIVEPCELTWSCRKHTKRKVSELPAGEQFDSTSTLHESENENTNSSFNYRSNNNYNSNNASSHCVESEDLPYQCRGTKKGKATIDCVKPNTEPNSNVYSRDLQNINGCDYRTNNFIQSDTSCRSTNSKKYDNMDEIISVDVVNKKIFTVSELLDRNESSLLSHCNTSTASNTTRGIPKSQSCVEYASIQRRKSNERKTDRPKSLSGRRVAVRHRDAEEALSSLLWQPYECREEVGEWSGKVNEAGSAGAFTHSLLGVRYGETCAAVMRLTVPAPALCRAAQPATGLEPKQVAINSEPKQGENSGIHNNVNNESVANTSVSVNNLNENINVISGNRVSVNGEVIGCDVISGDNIIQVENHAPRRSWTSCGAQTEEAMVGGGPPLAPPPYSTLPPPHPHHPLPLPIPMQSHGYPFQPVTLRRCQYGEDSEPPKTCCGAIGTRTIGLKWFIVLVALAGICCVLVGTVLGAVRAQGRAHLTVLLLMIGVGLVLVLVSGLAWRAISRRRRSTTASTSPVGASRRTTTASCMRAHHPYAAMLYPEFHCRPPPPSYQASMHEYRLRLLLLDRAASPPPLACPPPAYRPRPRGVTAGPAPYVGRGARGRRRAEPRSTATPISAVVIQNIGLEPYDDIKYDQVQEMGPPIVSESKEEEVQENKEGNLVTIVQTGEDTSPVIVTVSGSMPEERSHQTTSEIDILAHL